MSCKYNNCKICGYKTECEIYKENTELEKSCDETQELLDKQIEATYKLDKENAELIQENEEMKNGLGCETCQIHLEYMRLNNKIADLEKENTELKDGRDINVFTKQLTKAKEYIENLLYYTKQCTCERSNYAEIEEDIKEAEQFLNKEVEK